MKIIDGHNLQKRTEKPINWLVEGILPLGIAGDVYGPPDEGKSTVLLSLALAIASGQETWMGREITNGRVSIVGGEKSSEDVWVRDIHRIGQNIILDPGQMAINIDDIPLWQWNKKENTWMETNEHKILHDYLLKFEPTLIIIDTLSRACAGGNVIDYEQQSMLARKVEEMRKNLNTTIISISHTNQSSQSYIAPIPSRLHWMSRSGASGVPGIFRWLAGVTRVRSTDEINTLIGYDLQGQKVVAFAVSKCNEIPPPLWNIYNPLILEINGGIEMIGRVSIESKKKKKNNGNGSKQKGENVYEKEVTERPF